MFFLFSPIFPRFVVISTIPLIAELPYNTEAFTSLNTEMLSTSDKRRPSTSLGSPSTTNSAFPESVPLPVKSATSMLIPIPRILVFPSIPNARPAKTPLAQTVLSSSLMRSALSVPTTPTTLFASIFLNAIFTESFFSL